MLKTGKAYSSTILNVFPSQMVKSLLPMSSTRLFKRDIGLVVIQERIHESVDSSLRKQTLMPLQSEIEIHHLDFPTASRSEEYATGEVLRLVPTKTRQTDLSPAHSSLALSLFWRRIIIRQKVILMSFTQSRGLTPEAR